MFKYYFAISSGAGHGIGSFLVFIGALFFIFGFIPNLFALRKLFDSPEELARKWETMYWKDPLKFTVLGGFTSNELRRFRDSLAGNDTGDIEPKDIPEFKLPSHDAIHQKVNELILLFSFSALAIVIGYILL